MRLRDAKKLQNRDQVRVRKEGGWEYGYVLGEPVLVNLKNLSIPVESPSGGFREVLHTDVR